ncbi:multidrug efflux SMR transporter [uncultured Faecalicoccus sp.]|uniref:DMT family transporter n=1 Tax=uncultured Faecalicoccus sp. TaxID=1971760 RepID=UPI00261939FB|nr:multidrug efflux SMR transporter [uncultured Faecalicoccus sp.]
MEYVLLGIAIFFEILASSLLHTSKGFTQLWPSLGCIVFYSICFFAFSKALLKIDLGIAYATWSAVGIIATTIIGVLIFDQKLTMIGGFSILLIIVGCLLLNLYGSPR